MRLDNEQKRNTKSNNKEEKQDHNMNQKDDNERQITNIRRYQTEEENKEKRRTEIRINTHKKVTANQNTKQSEQRR